MCYDFQSLYNLEYILSFFLVHIVSYPLKVKQLIKGGKKWQINQYQIRVHCASSTGWLKSKSVWSYISEAALQKKKKKRSYQQYKYNYDDYRVYFPVSVASWWAVLQRLSCHEGVHSINALHTCNRLNLHGRGQILLYYQLRRISLNQT